jgi:DNA-binding transcriptional ArsR family regulator
MAAADSMDLVFNALADAGRRRLLDALHGRDGQTLGELCVLLTMSRQAVSKHLGILERANLIATQKFGRRKLHYLNPVPIHMITRRWIRKYQPQQLDVLLDIKDKLENES